MGIQHGIEAETWVAIDNNCHMSCEVQSGEFGFVFGRLRDGLRVGFDRHALLKFMRLAHDVVREVDSAQGGSGRVVVSADELSRDAHYPNG